MEWFIPMLIAFLCFVAVFYVQQRQYDQAAVRMPYHLKRPVLSPEQAQLEEQLRAEFGERFLILTQVRVAQVVEIAALPRRSYWYHAVNRIAPLHFDHLLCRREDLAPAGAIRLGHPPNAPQDFLRELCEAVELPLVELSTDDLQRYGNTRDKVERALGQASQGRPAGER